VALVSRAVRASQAAGQDRLLCECFGKNWLLVIADGAGGVSGGAEAADLVVSAARTLDQQLQSIEPDDLVQFLEQLDIKISRTDSAGESTALIAVVRDARVLGASVGDSEAWLLSGGSVIDLTSVQVRKPLIGSGEARPTSFGPFSLGGRLVLGSDGLFKYCPRAKLLETTLTAPIESAADDLAALVKLPSGDLFDDVAVIVFTEIEPSNDCNESSESASADRAKTGGNGEP
jgi:serine/threonine protein phosphatase PrpC